MDDQCLQCECACYIILCGLNITFPTLDVCTRLQMQIITLSDNNVVHTFIICIKLAYSPLSSCSFSSSLPFFALLFQLYEVSRPCPTLLHRILYICTYIIIIKNILIRSMRVCLCPAHTSSDGDVRQISVTYVIYYNIMRVNAELVYLFSTHLTSAPPEYRRHGSNNIFLSVTKRHAQRSHNQQASRVRQVSRIHVSCIYAVKT